MTIPPGSGPPPGQAAKKNNPSSVTSVYACDNNEFVKLLLVNAEHAYHVTGTINEIHAQFMLDTRATISLLRPDVWNKIVPVVNTTLQEWNGCQLMGAEGNAI